MKSTILLFILFVSLAASSQTVSGFYSGTLYNDTTKLLQQYELALSEYRGKITGYSYVTFVSNDTFYYGIRRVTGRIEGNNLIVKDDKFIANNFPEAPAKGVNRLFVIPLAETDTIKNLSGTWQTNRTKTFYSIPGTVTASRSNDSAGSALFAHLRELELMPQFAKEAEQKPASENKSAVAKTESREKNRQTINNPAPKQPAKDKKEAIKPVVTVAAPLPFEQRSKKEMKSIEISGDSLVLAFYDNGVIDGDSISVYMNGVNIVSNIRLAATATRKTIAFKEPGDFEILLVAENLGTIPPNTGLLMIQDGDQTYQLHFTADMQTNASIILKRKKK